jgi:D-3-phosphoglycerate dehydrogenase
MKILIADNFALEGQQVFERADGLEVAYLPGLSHEELLVEVADADALIVRGGTAVTEEVFAAAKQLKVVGRAGLSIENMDLAAANRKGVIVMNTPFGSTTTTAEHTIAMLLALARNIPAADASIKAGRWEKERYLGTEISGKTIGVIGAGKIGRLVVDRAIGLKMQPIVYDPYLSEEAVRQMGAEQVDFDHLLAQSDFMTLHVPLNAETRHLLGAEEFEKMKPGCRVVNCAMSGLIDDAALIAAVRTGQVAGVALDIFDTEPLTVQNPLWAMDKVICTPHLRAATTDAQINVTVQIAQQVVDFLQRGIIVNGVNVPSISAELLAEMRPYIELAEKLGAFEAQVNGRGLKKVCIEYAGTVTRHPVEHLTTAMLKSLLTPMYGSMVNYVNAPHLAQESGIEVVDMRSTATGGFENSICLTVVDTDGEHSVGGALFSVDDYRIVSVDDYHVEASPDGHLLVIYNQDCPGVIGTVGQVLADAGINIAMMNLSRRKFQGKAVSLVNVDSKIPDDVLQRLRDKEFILSAVQVYL